MTTELQKVEDDLDAAESRLADVNLQLEQAEQQMDENGRYCTIFVDLNTSNNNFAVTSACCKYQ